MMKDFSYVILFTIVSLGLFFIFDQSVEAAELNHSYYEQNTVYNATHGNTNFNEIPTINMDSGNFTVGNKYLLMVNLEMAGQDGSHEWGVHTLHGGTVFDGSLMQREQGKDTFRPYQFMTVWTAVASEDITIETKTYESDHYVAVDKMNIFAMEISEEFLEDRDWYFNSNSTHQTTQYNYPDHGVRGEITIDVDDATDDWLVMGLNNIDGVSTSYGSNSRINVDDVLSTAAAGCNSAWMAGHPCLSNENESNTAYHVHFLPRVYTFSEGEHTLRMEAATEVAAGNAWEYSSIFAINLDLFETHADNYIAEPGNVDIQQLSTCGADPDCEKNTITFTPATAGDFFILSFMGHGYTGNGYQQMRLQIDDVDDPPNQTTNSYLCCITQDGGDVTQLVISSMASLGTSSTDIDFDVTRINGHSGNRHWDAQIVAFSLEYLPPPTPPDPVIDLTSTSIGTNSVDLDWTEPDLNQGTLIGYQINFTTPQSTTVQSTGTIFLNDTGVIDDTITGLLSGTSYSATVAAWTELGNTVYGGNIYNFTTIFVPEGKYIWFNCSMATNSTQGCIYAFFCPVGEFVNGFYENGTASCDVP